ncbi:2-keto-3-deoxy-phosphogluconate aldolase [Streptomyces sp. 846.5]|nr:bifunctional 4-hydroxy-2-oxoglutarate aldolase/2-dehydro-3-deoxy-phosphogluconate aldolase [Streptomyces sp. 846.5]TDT97459.1 2-keto-3-deoxy-phosphogluconate aldolase [Streptomyces sp. 846.5]
MEIRPPLEAPLPEAPGHAAAPRPVQTRDSALREALGHDRIMAILRYRQGGDVTGAIEGLAEGGIRVLEVTVDTPGAWAAIERAATRPGLLVGAGTVTEVSQVERLAALGGRFVVSPGLSPAVVAAALALDLEALPGIATGTEVLAARRAGAEFFKLFPAAALGTPYLSQLRGPFGDESFIPTGGIGTDQVGDWLRAGAYAVALGSDLAGRAAPGGPQEIHALAQRARRALRQATVSSEQATAE